MAIRLDTAYRLGGVSDSLRILALTAYVRLDGNDSYLARHDGHLFRFEKNLMLAPLLNIN